MAQVEFTHNVLGFKIAGLLHLYRKLMENLHILFCSSIFAQRFLATDKPSFLPRQNVLTNTSK